MKIVIVGAGDLGQLLAERLSALDNDVVLIDVSRADFDRIHEHSDVMTLNGDACSVPVMKRADIANADVLLAVSGNSSTNMLACTLAHKLGTPKSICRIYNDDVFSEEDGITPSAYGISSAFSSLEECVRHVTNVIQHQLVLEQVEFSNPDATVVAIRIPANSILKGCRLQDIPDQNLLGNIRFAAIVRNHQLKYPHGDTMLQEDDRVYIAGSREYVSKFVDYASGEVDKAKKMVLIAGATRLSKRLAQDCLEHALDVRIIDEDEEACTKLLADLPSGVRMIHGKPTDEEVLHEAGVCGCEVFVSCEDDDENNILSCIIAKRQGARKVIAMTNKPEYISIVPAMDLIDCGINPTVVSVNTVFRLMEMDSYRIDTHLRAYQAYMSEFKIEATSPLVGKALCRCKFPHSVVLAMLFRGSQVLAPSGKTEFKAEDTIVAIVNPESESQLRQYIKRG